MNLTLTLMMTVMMAFLGMTTVHLAILKDTGLAMTLPLLWLKILVVANLAAHALIVVPLTTFVVALTAPNQSLGAHPLLLVLVTAAMDFPKPSLSKLRPNPRLSFL